MIEKQMILIRVGVLAREVCLLSCFRSYYCNPGACIKFALLLNRETVTMKILNEEYNITR